VSGDENESLAQGGFIGTGWRHLIEVAGTYSFIGSGQDNTISHTNCNILGSNITTNKADYTYVENLNIKALPTVITGLVAGDLWNNLGVVNVA
jgi:hypothetical protein